MASSLITKVMADISALERDLTKAEARWRKYEETARKAASLTLTGGTLGVASRGGGAGAGGASAATAQKSELKQAEENLKASLKRQQSELESALKQRLATFQTYEKARLEAVKSAFSEERDQRRRDASDARQAARQSAHTVTREQRQAAAAAREVFKEDARGQRGTKAFEAFDAKERKRASDELKAFEREEKQRTDKAERDAVRTFNDAERKKQRALRETAQEAKRTARIIAQADAEGRRAAAGDLRGQIRQLVGTGAGAGPPFRPIPPGSRPEDIRALRQHLAEANTAGARLSRTLRRIGDEDLKNAAQSARFFGNAIKLAAGAAIFGGFVQLVKQGINLNREWERFRFGLGTALALTSKVVDAQGNVVKGARAFAVFAKDGEKLFQTIREEANKTILTTEELTQVVTSNFALAIRAGVPEKEIVGLSNRIATFAKTIGLQGGTPQLVQEVRAILSGGPLRGAQIAQALGLTEKDLKAAKDQRQILQLINKSLADAKPLADKFAVSSEAAFTTLTSKAQTFLRLSLEDVFKRITGRVLDFNKALSEENIAKFAKTAGGVLSSFFKPIEAFIDSGRGEKLAETFGKAFKFLGDVANSKFFDALLKVLNYAVDHHREILALGLLFTGGRALNAANTSIASLGAAGGLFANTKFGRAAAGGIPGLFGAFKGTPGAAAGTGAGGFANVASSAAASAQAAKDASEGFLRTAATTAAGGAAVKTATVAGVGLVAAAIVTAAAAAAELAIAGTLIKGIIDLPKERAAQAKGRLPGTKNIFGTQRSRKLPPELLTTIQKLGPKALEKLGLGDERISDEDFRAQFQARLDVRTERRNADQSLALTREAAVSARSRGEEVTRGRQFTVFEETAKGETQILKLSLESAEKRVQIAKEREEKLGQIAKAGGDRRVQNVTDINSQIVNLEKLAAEQRITQLEGNVRKEIELDLVAELQKARAGKDAIGNPDRLRRFEVAAVENRNRKIAELNRTAFFDTAKAEAEAANNRVQARRVELGRQIAAIQEEVRTRKITAEQGQIQIAAATKKTNDDQQKDFRDTRANAADLATDFARLTIRAEKERRDAVRETRDFNRQVAREARDQIRQRIEAERGLTDAIVQQSQRREDVGLRRKGLGLKREEVAQRKRIEEFVIQNLFGNRNTVDIEGREGAQEIADEVLSGRSRNAFELQGRIQDIAKGRDLSFSDQGFQRSGEVTLTARQLAFRLIGEEFAARKRRLGGTVIEREQEALGLGREAEALGLGTRFGVGDEIELAQLRLQAAAGNRTGAERLGLLERKRVAATTGTELVEGDRGVLRQREDLADLVTREKEAREKAVEDFAELRERFKNVSLGLKEDLIQLGKRAQELLPNFAQFGEALKGLGNVINEIAKLTPAGAAARAVALGPASINLTVDLKGGLPEGSVTDPIVQRVLGLALEKLQQELKRGPVGR